MNLQPATVEDPEKKAKNDAKKRVKEEKKLKAKEKEAAAKLKAQQGASSSKASKKKIKKQDATEENPEDYIHPETPYGEKKQLSRKMAKDFSPNTVENSWYSYWEKSRFFEAKSQSSKPPFVMILPPPNVTGALHIGHALTVAIQDTIIRWLRMSGYNAVWIPGTDHAGIATQAVVEKRIMKESERTRHDLGRENFVSEVWKYTDEFGGTIQKQLRRLGASLDWSRECFTMDEKRSKGVTEAFVRLHEEGLIVRRDRLVNWDCFLRTAVSDIEVDYMDIKERTLLVVPGYKNKVEFGVLTSFAYPLEDGIGEIVVATTRVETMLGDTAIAVHSQDSRYSHFHRKFAIHPFNGRKLPIICDDDLVDADFGTGAVKITPAHDPNDFKVGMVHDLESINIFTDDGKINSNGGSEFVGMPRFEARVAVIEALKSKGLFRSEKDNEMRLGLCSRSNDVIEPMRKPQWYVKCDDMAKEALDAVINEKNKKIDILPKQYVDEWKRWLENIQDWCISRQLWWGHRVPAWYVMLEDDESKELNAYTDRWVVARNEEDAMVEAERLFTGKKVHELTQDPDVLDTWFSSGLFPLTGLGWPDETHDFKLYYPNSVLETGHDILFFWCARMVMLGMKLGGDAPFTKVYLHPMIRDKSGRKMSKSLGNVIDPIDVIQGITLEDLQEKLKNSNLDTAELDIAKQAQIDDFPNGIQQCGTDALRFSLVSYTSQSEKINLDVKRVYGYRRWCNKIWHATRFAISKLGDDYTPPSPASIAPARMPFSCQWILSVLNKSISKTISSLDSYEFSDASNAVYSWWQYQLCDTFIELIKPYFHSEDPLMVSARGYAQDTLWICLDYGLRLLHPFMPFITEELWQRLPAPQHETRKESIMLCEYPSIVERWTDERAEYEMGIIESAVKSLRSIQEKERVTERLASFAVAQTDEIADLLRRHEKEVLTLATLSSLTILTGTDGVPPGCKESIVNKSLSVYLKLQGAINIEKEREKHQINLTELQKQIASLRETMSYKSYEDKTPANIKERDDAKLASLKQQLVLCEEATKHFEQEFAATASTS